MPSAAFLGSIFNIPVSGASDPYFANVVALLHLDSNYTDQIGTVWTPTGTPVFETASPIAGSGSLKFAASAQTVTSASSSLFNFGTGDFTLEFAIKFFGTAVGSTPAGWYFMDAGSGNLTAIQWNPSGKLAYYSPVTTDTGALYSNGPANTTITDGNVHRIAVSRASGTTRAFCDGTMWASQTGDTSNKTHTTFCLNKYGGDTTHGGLGYMMDEVRITKGVARYTANYSPSSFPMPFPNS